MDLTGKVAIVTGSGRGLGLAYAERLATNGAAVVVNDVAEEVAEAAADHVRVAGGKATAVTAAVGSSETADMLVAEALSEFGRVDILVSNAGVLRDKVLWKMTDEDFDLVIDVHLRGTFTCARAVVTQLREQGEGGRLIWLAHRPVSAATSARPTTRRPRQGSSRSLAPGRWSWLATTSR